MIELKFLGGANEVGRSSVLAQSGDERFLFDYGISVQSGEIPVTPKLPLTAMFITHAHVDHSGLIPELYKRGWKGNVFGTGPTQGLSNMLLEDSIKVQKKRGQIPHFHPMHIKVMNSYWKAVNYNKLIKFKNSSARFLDAGHIPGSSSVVLETGGKKILYTGDIKFSDTRLLKGSNIMNEKTDILIMESTYHYKNHPARKELEDNFREVVQNTVYNNGIALVPAFAVGRTQEIISILSDLGFPIYMDGMGIEATDIMLNYPNFLKDPKKLGKAFGRAFRVKRTKDRKEALSKPCIVVSTAGMLNGGPIGYYIKRLYDREDCSLILTGYQVEGTVGRALVDTGRYMHEGIDAKLKMPFQLMDFSAHCGRDSLIELVKKTNPEKVFVMHGGETPKFALELKELGFDAYAPESGDSFKV